MIAHLADRTVTILRRSSLVVVQAAAAATLTVAAQPVRASAMKATVAGGQTGSGTVTFSGPVNGTPDSETLIFTANGSKLTMKQFTAITGITTAGLASESPVPTVKVEACDSAGSPQSAESTLATGLAVTLDENSAYSRGFPVDQQGASGAKRATVYLDWTEAFTPRKGDLVQDEATGDVWRVDKSRLLRSSMLPHHYELDVVEHQER